MTSSIRQRLSQQFPIMGYAKSFAHDFIVRCLQTGPIPQHIAIVMDGNRRFAKSHNLELSAGHYAGAETLMRILDVSSHLGINTVTVYAFSIENFNRDPEEVEGLFNLLRTRLNKLLEEDGPADRLGLRIRILGDRSLLPDDILSSIQIAEERTKTATSLNLNICCPYTSRDDIGHAIAKVVRDGEQQRLASDKSDKFNGEDSNATVEDRGITATGYNSTDAADTTLDADPSTLQGFSKLLYTGVSPPLDILIRTSGATRFSDFMLWESVGSNCDIVFTETLWPDFGSWELYRIVLKWSYFKSRQLQKLEKLHILETTSDSLPPLVSVAKRTV